MSHRRVLFAACLGLLVALPPPAAAQSPVYLSQWGSCGSGPAQFNGHEGVAVDPAGNVYVADTFNHRVMKFTSAGEPLLQWGSLGTGAGQFDTPEGIAVDASGYVYVADTNNSRIQKFTGMGDFVAQWSGCDLASAFQWPCGVAVDGSGNIYVADTFNSRIVKLNSSGSCVGTLWAISRAPSGQVLDHLQEPWAVAVDGTGNVFVADTGRLRIAKFSATGAFLAVWGGWAVFQNPVGIATDAAGNVYVSDNSYTRLQIYSGTGTLLYGWGSAGTGDSQFGWDGPRGLAVDPAGNVFVTDPGNCRIQKFGYPATPTVSDTWGRLKAHYRR